MQFKTAALFFAGLAAATCPPRNPDGLAAGDELREWALMVIDEFFPYRPGWEAAYDEYFSPDVAASFNATMYDFEGFKGFLQTTAYPLLHDGFAGTFEHGIRDIVAVPYLGDRRGGFVTATGWEYGLRFGNPDLPYNRTNAAFGVVTENDDCELQVTEWRETSNLGKI